MADFQSCDERMDEDILYSWKLIKGTKREDARACSDGSTGSIAFTSSVQYMVIRVEH